VEEETIEHGGADGQDSDSKKRWKKIQIGTVAGVVTAMGTVVQLIWLIHPWH